MGLHDEISLCGTNIRRIIRETSFSVVVNTIKPYDSVLCPP